MIANKRLPKITLSKSIDILIISFVAFGTTGMVLDLLGIITTEVGPKIVSLALAIGLILHLFTANYFAKIVEEKDSEKYNILLFKILAYSVVPAFLITELLPISSDIEYGVKPLLAGLLLLINLIIENKRSK